MTQPSAVRVVAFLFWATSFTSAIAAEVQGVVRFQGPAPEMPKIRLSADPACIKAHGNNPPTRQDVVVNPNETLKNTIVYIKEGLPLDATYPAPKEPAILDQRGCMYKPHVLALRTGQELQILNSDPTIHNVNAQAKNNSKFNASMLNNKVPPMVRKFNKPELPVPIRCDVHPWMLAWVAVFDHPYFDVTGEDGSFRINGLPPGDYTLATWHEKLSPQEVKLTVKDDVNTSVTFAYKTTGAPAAR